MKKRLWFEKPGQGLPNLYCYSAEVKPTDSNFDEIEPAIVISELADNVVALNCKQDSEQVAV